MKYICTLLLLLNSIAFAASDDYLDINTIQLEHRLASDLIGNIEPFLPESATIRAHSDLLILKSDPQTFYEVQALIKKLDTPLQRLKVTVLRTHASLSELQGSSVNVEFEVNDAVHANTQVQRWSNRSNKDENNYYSAQGISNEPILIHMTQSKPQQEQLVLFNSSGDQAVSTTTHYINIDNGFKAIVQARPNKQVKVEIHPVFGEINSQDQITHSQVFTTIAGPVNHWLSIGQINNEKSIENSALTRYTTQRNQQNLYLKVEFIP